MKILEDSKCLNIALKQVLQFGPERSIPVEERVKNIITPNDENAIKELCEKVKKVQNKVESIFWNYYNYDNGNLDIDAKPLIYEIAPWIDDENYSHIYSQCMYFVMRG